jgi:hypothetical protein
VRRKSVSAVCVEGSLTYRPVLGIQWVVWAVECDSDIGDLFLTCLCCRGIAAMAGHPLETVLLVLCEYFDLFAVSQE